MAQTPKALPSLRCATPPFAFRPEFLARLTVQAFGIGLIRARLRGCLFTCGAGHRGGCRRRWSLRRRGGGGDDERQDGCAKCHRSHGASFLSKRDEARRPHSITSSARSRNDSGTARPSALAVARLITSSNLIVRGHSGPTQQRRTLCCVGSGCAPLFATSWKLPQAGSLAPSSLPQSMLSPLWELH